MNEKRMIALIVIFALLTTFNVCGILCVDALEAKPESFYQVEVLGAVFKEESEPNTIDVHLVRPPRKAVFPGEETEEKMTLTNTVDFPIYMRASYRVEVKDENGNVAEDMLSDVSVKTNKDWYYQDGYWYYKAKYSPERKSRDPLRAFFIPRIFLNIWDIRFMFRY